MNFVHKKYDELFNLDNIFNAWKRFRRGKSKKNDVMNFEMHLEDNLFSLYTDLHNFTYKHSSYKYFQVFDNKKRDIYKAQIRDRVVHQIVFDYLVSFFDPEFISSSFASRKEKGQYKAINNFRYFIKLASDKNKSIFVLKCDVRKYFESINQEVLINLVKNKISCQKTLSVIIEIINSYAFSKSGEGIPLGNITSQIFANIYLDVLDKYVKNFLKCRLYVRYNDDFIIVSDSKEKLEKLRNKIKFFTMENLKIDIPFEKTSIRKVTWGIDFLGFKVLPKAILVRNKTKNKIFLNIKKQNLNSYFGILKHCNSYNLKRKILGIVDFG